MRAPFLAVPLLIVAALIGMFFFLNEPSFEDVLRDDDLCPVDPDLAGSVETLLMDFRKPIDGASADLPGNLLRNLTLDSRRNTEFRVYFLTGAASAPRALLKRLCKPYDNDDLQVLQAKDQNGAFRDCDNLPAQLADSTRRSAVKFCAARQVLQRRMNALAANVWPEDRVVTDAYLVEAFEDIRMEFSERPGPHRLHVFSDMLQHANWYSHLDLDWLEWDYEEFADLLNARSRMYGPRRDNSRFRVDVYYLPRSGKTDRPRVKELHREFWRNYFEGTRVAFHDQPPVPAYASRPLMNLMTEAELAAQEREATERLLIELENEQLALAEEQRELEAQRRRQAEAARQTELANRRRAVVERQLEAERLLEADTELESETAAVSEQQSGERLEPAPHTQFATGPQVEEESADIAEPDPPLAEPGPPLDEPESPVPESERLIAGSERAMIAGSAASSGPGSPSRDEGQALPAHQAVAVETAPDSSSIMEPDPAAVELPLCPLIIPSNLEDWRPEYPNPGGQNFGDAVITVSYVIDEQGETEDREVVVVPERSGAERTRYFNRFAREAVSTVRDWSFSFAETGDQPCIKRRTSTTSFRFQYDQEPLTVSRR